MPFFTIETTYHLPVYRQRTYEAATIEQACDLATADEGWDDGKSDVDTSGDTYVTGLWEGADSAYAGKAIPIPSQFNEQVERKASHFETLLGILKVLAHETPSPTSDPPFWHQRAAAAIAKAEAILTGSSDPEIEGGAP